MTTLEHLCQRQLNSSLLHSCYIVARLEEVEKGEAFVKQDGKGFHGVLPILKKVAATGIEPVTQGL